MRLSRVALASCGVIAASVVIVRCLGPTEITLQITTDIPCASLDGVAIVIGPPGELETRDPITVTQSCSGTNVGTLVVTPSEIAGPVGIAVIAGTHGSPDVPAESCRGEGYANCVVARREISFLTHTPLTLPIELSSACENFPCASDSTTVQTCVVVNGQPQCVGASIPDPNQCIDASCQPTVSDSGSSDGGIHDAGNDGDATIVTQHDASTTPPGTLTTIVAGGNSTCAKLTVNNGSEWWCWGQNDKGQLSFTSNVAVLTPQRAASLDNFKSVSLGINHSCGIDANGGVECWGDNTYGQLGDGTMTPHTVPAPINLSGADVRVGDDFSCSLTTSTVDGGSAGVSCWGSNARYQLGTTGSTTATPTPVKQLYADALRTGAAFACGQLASEISCWGDNSYGQLDQSSAIDASATPYAVTSGATGPTGGLALGANHACAPSASGVVCWGDNQAHQSSASDSIIVTTTPSQLTPAPTLAAAGAEHTCVMFESSATDAGNVECTGDNSLGQIGNGGIAVTTFTRNASVYLDTITAGENHTCGYSLALQKAFCWGDNASGQLGDGTTSERTTPVAVEWP